MYGSERSSGSREADGTDFGRVVARRAGGWRIVLLRVVSAGADHVVGVVRGAQRDRGDVRGIGELGVLGLQAPGEVDPGLRLVLGRVLLGVGVQDRALGLAGAG